MSTLSWILPQTPVTDNELLQIESVSGFPLPEDFKSWLLKHNGACPKPSAISLKDGFVLDINSFVSFSEKDSPNVLALLKMLKGRLSEGLIPIAGDYGGSYVCLRYSPNTTHPNIVYWDHEEANQSMAVKPITTSFTELVKLLGSGPS